MAFIKDLSEKERKLLEKYENNSYEDLYNQNDEEELYNTAKTLRKANEYPEAKLNKEDPVTYSNFISTKPKEGSAGASLQNGYVNWLQEIKQQSFGQETLDSLEETRKSNRNKRQVVGEAIKGVSDKTLKPFLRTGAQVFDKVTDTLVKKGVGGVMSAQGAVYYNVGEMWDSYKPGGDKDYEFLKAGEKWEDYNEVLEYTFGSHFSMNDYLDFRTSEEKARDIIKDKPLAEQEYFKKLDSTRLLVDVAGGIMSGVGVSGALGKLSTLGKIATAGNTVNKTTKVAGVTSKVTPVVGKVATVLDKTLNPSLNNMAKAGIITAGVAIPYYGLTGKWIFEDDREATEGAGIVLGGLGLKGIGKAGLPVYEYVKKLFQDSDFKKGVQMFQQKSKEIFPPVKEYPEYSEVERKSIHKKINELRAINQMSKEGDPELTKLKNDSLDFHPKADNILDLVDDGILKETGRSTTKQGKEIISYGYTEQGEKFLTDRALAKLNKGKTIGFHHDANIISKASSERNAFIPDGNAEEFFTKITDATKETPNKLKQKIIKEGLWNNNKSDFSNYKDFYYNRFTRKFVSNAERIYGELIGDTGVKRLITKANRGNMIKMEQDKIFGKTSLITKKAEKIKKIVGDDYEEFSKYIWAKSRLEKLKSNKTKGKELLTSYRDNNGNKVKVTEDMLETIVNSRDAKFGALGDELQELNRDVLMLYKKAGIYSDEQFNNYFSRRHYVPDKEEVDVLEKIASMKNYQPQFLPIGNKGLKEGSLDIDYSMNGFDNLVKSMIARTNEGNKIYRINEIMRITDNPDIARYIDAKDIGKKKIPEGMSVLETFQNGEKKYVIMRKFMADEILENKSLSNSSVYKTATIPTRILKTFATGALNPIFAIKSITWELPNALAKNFIEKGSLSSFVRSLAFNNLYGNFNAKAFKEGKFSEVFTTGEKKAMQNIMTYFGADFSNIKYLSEEFGEGKDLGNSFYNFMSKKSEDIAGEKATKVVGTFFNNKLTRGVLKSGKGIYKLGENIGHSLEMHTSRIPLFEAQLRKQGMDSAKFSSLVGQADGSTEKLIKLMQDEGFDLHQASNVARSVFDYTIASKNIREISRMYPYLNTAVSSQTTAMKRMWETDPKRFYSSVIIPSFAMAYEMVAFNTGTKGLIGDYTNEEKNELFNKQNDYVKHKVGFTWFTDNERDGTYSLELGRNIPFVEWFTPLLVEAKKGEEPDWIRGFSKFIEDTTYFIDLNREGLPVDIGKLATPLLKPALEVNQNKDFFYDKKLIEDWVKQEEIKTMEYDKFTSPVFIKLARSIALMTGGEVGPGNIISGGKQFSPIKLQKLSTYVDPLGKTRKLFEGIFTDLEIIKGDTSKEQKKLYQLFLKTYNTKTSDDEIFKMKESTDMEKIISNNIKLEISKVKNQEELKETIDKLIQTYGELPDFEKKADTFNKQVNNKVIEMKYGKSIVYETSLGAENMAEYYFNVLNDSGEEAFKKKLSTIVKLKEDGLFTERKFKSLEKHLGELMSKQ